MSSEPRMVTENSAQLKGQIYSLQRFAIHDGPGIRTLVYLKGCPASCLWCSSPQTQNFTPDILYIELHCKGCGRCREACPIGAISLTQGEKIVINRDLCTGCGECVEACPNQALELAGYQMTVDELFQEVKKDSSFYRRSEGGVTVGGGEPTMQPEFVTSFLRRCRQQYINTAMETCGYVEWKHLKKLLEFLDLVYIDIKHMNPASHKELTGLSNELILKNARRASAIRPVIIRIPIVPGYNDSDDNILATARFTADSGETIKRIELLPYHNIGTQTYKQLGREYKLKDVEPPSARHMKRLKEVVESCGVSARIGG